MTRGAEPKYAETPYAQWIKRRLEELGWNKQDLAARVRDESGGRLAQPGASRLVLRATQGANISTPNRELIARILGPSEPPIATQDDLLARLEAIEDAIAELPTAQDMREALEAVLARLPPATPAEIAATQPKSTASQKKAAS